MKKSISLVPGPAFASRGGAEKQRERRRCPEASITCLLLVNYLEVNAFPVESNVNSECGGVVVRDEQRLLIRFIPHHKVQGIGALMRKDTLVSRTHRNHREHCT